MKHANMNWNDANKVATYRESIPLKIPAYHTLHTMMSSFLTAGIHEKEPGILIVGGGGGKELDVLAKRHSHWHYTIVDPSNRMLELAARVKEQLPFPHSVTLCHGDLSTVPYERLYSAITCLLVAHFIENEKKPAFLQDMYRRLKPGGMLVITTMNDLENHPSRLVYENAWQDFIELKGCCSGQWNTFKSSFGKTTHLMASDTFEQLLTTTGFQPPTRFFSSFLIDGWIAFKEA
ncbi:class I SAM-dependent methyltransferase [Salipaludibacillus agaradhaerens]|uniref:Class I SAM-dependent methyltransferase n=1 Tax=Salipaludibacillus agaradhaerens TaxID=76935 RepID=A0A9Q4B472_SALAG|nr:class I SAM-dependent methyltransferase [Salipaludibacillus agaradhaerens]MCR6098038.1 class I SAM-dependent methyltransferase [Salipaludibacillus agaradhaerens]MCR6116333.1 class I SAM-dependent methyltransferase [Salipaludibacillus agaradhaerens]